MDEGKNENITSGQRMAAYVFIGLGLSVLIMLIVLLLQPDRFNIDMYHCFIAITGGIILIIHGFRILYSKKPVNIGRWDLKDTTRKPGIQEDEPQYEVDLEKTLPGEMKCPYCGSVISKKEKECPYCYVEIEKEEE